MANLLDQKSSIKVTRYSPANRMPLHCDGEDKVSFILAGSVRESSKYGEKAAFAGSMVTKPADFGHENEVGGDGMTVLSLQVHSCNSELEESWRKLVSDYRWLGLHPSTKLMLSLWVEGIEETESTIEELIFGLSSAKEQARCPEWFRKVEGILSDQLIDPPSLIELAEEIAVHPVTLSRAFTSVGTSKSAMTHQIRMKRALQKFGSNTPLNLIAADLGYSDASHFSRTFTRWFGMAPEAYRKTFCSSR